MFLLNKKERNKGCDYWCKCNYCMFDLCSKNQYIYSILNQATPERHLELELFYAHDLRLTQYDKTMILSKCLRLILKTSEAGIINESLISVIKQSNPQRNFILTYAIEHKCKPLLNWGLTTYSQYKLTSSFNPILTSNENLTLTKKEYDEEKQLYKKYKKEETYNEIIIYWKSIKKNRNVNIINF